MVDSRNSPLDDQPNDSALVSARVSLMRDLNLSSSTEVVQAFSGIIPDHANQIHTALGLSDDELIRLRKVAQDLTTTAGLNVEVTVAATGIAATKIERVRDLARELLTDPEIYSVELDRVNFTEVLHDMSVPRDIVESMAEAGLTSLSHVRQIGANALMQIRSITPELAAILTAHAQLSTISSDVTLNRNLIEAGITRVGEIAKLREYELSSRIQAEPTIIRTLHQRASVLSAAADVSFLDAVVSLIPSNRVYDLAIDGSISEQLFRLAAPVAAPDACQTCDACLSALSPAAYLVDLVDFLIDNFSALQLILALELHRRALRTWMIWIIDSDGLLRIW